MSSVGTPVTLGPGMNEKLAAKSVLLVDDEAYFRRFVGAVLTKEGVGKVVEAKNGKEAVDIFNAQRPDFVVLDINMPHMDGMETLKAMRSVEGDIPIIMLTSIADEMVVEQCVNEGATYFIRKDVPAPELAAELKTMLQETLGDGGGEEEAT
jgi:CheY-like chemotaxis protein